jgi:hypothetical protein
MCASFQSAATAAGWTAHPEIAGHDLVLVAGPNVTGGWEPGDHVVVEAKLRAGVDVLVQALPPLSRAGWGRTAPAAHGYFVLVPECTREFREVAAACGVGVRVWACAAAHLPERVVFLSAELRDPVAPGLVVLARPVAMAAGAPAPRAVTRWKVEAVRLCLRALVHPERLIDRSEFVHVGIDARLWLRRGWLRPVAGEKPPRYQLTDAEDRPDLLYPEIVEAVREEVPGDR